MPPDDAKHSLPPHPSSHPHRICVYGTLKRGGTNHHWMDGQVFLGRARLGPGHTMYSLGEYPGLVPEAGGEDRVVGELWAVNEPGLAGLDELEGVAEGLYARVPVLLSEGPWSGDSHAGTLPEVQTYLYLRSISGRTKIGEIWPTSADR